MVVDERTNALIFYTTGSRYRELLPMLSKLDLLPKQVALDIIIAEVSLQDEFKYGVEWALSRSQVNLATSGAFGVAGIGGMGLIINGTEGPVNANFLDSNSLVNVLSRPTIMVRDGVAANINVGSDISVVGQTTQDPINGERQTTSSEYRKTGLDVSVTPTINSNNVVTMEISQTISNSVPDSSGAGGNPDIFERSINTELVAGSGQTVMMAGLISESSSSGDKGAPLLNKIPLLGGLFESNAKSTDRTELIMLITPRVIASLDNWDAVISDFREGLRFMSMDDVDQAQ
jgi:general secretion pathway protein D